MSRKKNEKVGKKTTGKERLEAEGKTTDCEMEGKTIGETGRETSGKMGKWRRGKRKEEKKKKKRGEKGEQLGSGNTCLSCACV